MVSSGARMTGRKSEELANRDSYGSMLVSGERIIGTSSDGLAYQLLVHVD